MDIMQITGHINSDQTSRWETWPLYRRALVLNVCVSVYV